MTNIDFYILPEDTVAARDHFACRLAEKAMNMGRQVVISVSDEDHGASISDYLWSFKPESFVPHIVTHAVEGTPKEKIFIDWQHHTHDFHDVLINLTDDIPKTFSQFKKLSEIVIQEDTVLTRTRKHFTFYRDRGYPLKSHKIS